MHIGNTQLTLTLTAADGYCANVAGGGAGDFLWKAALHAQIWLVSSSGGKAATAASGSMKAIAHRWERRKDQRLGETRPMLNVWVLPPSQNQENVILPTCVLLVMNPAIPLLLARCMRAIPMCLRLRAGHIRTGAVVVGMDTDGGESR
jgi:hypothetical protein